MHEELCGEERRSPSGANKLKWKACRVDPKRHGELRDSKEVKIITAELKSALGAVRHRIDTAENISSNVKRKYEKLTHGLKVRTKD